jgi:hypothetical protein
MQYNENINTKVAKKLKNYKMLTNIQFYKIFIQVKCVTEH